MVETPGAIPGEQGATFGARLRRARAAANLTQEELAERAGLTPNAVGALERGEHRHPYPATVRALADALGLSDDERAALAASVPKRVRVPAPTEATAPVLNLPASLSPLIGREAEVAAVSGLLRRDEVRLVTLTGPGGVGKTSLALRIAAELSGDFADGAVFVPLAAVRDPALVASTIAQVLGVVEAGVQSLVDRLGDSLRDRDVLLVLDNLEHLLDAAPLITDLLARCPRLVVLATSRATLRLAGEHDVPVQPLALPDPERLTEIEGVADVAAIRLFVERARAADPAFALTADNAAAVAAICARLDGLPLAIELAAARSRLFPPAALLPRLARRLPLLVGGRRDAPSRHQTMRDAIGWSYDLLSADDQVLFRRLAVFSDGFTLEAAGAVYGEAMAEAGYAERSRAPDEYRRSPVDVVLEGVSSLVDQRLLHPVSRSDGEPRFAMLETIREYAGERLAVSGEEAAIRDAHAIWCLALAERAAPFWFTPAQATWGERLDAEHDNLRAALARSAELGETDDGLRLAGRLWPYWFVRGHHTEGRAWLERALASESGIRTIERVRALTGLSCFVRDQGDEPIATSLGEEALRIADEIGAGTGIDAVHVLIGLGLTAVIRDDFAQATLLDEAALAILRGLGETYPSAAPLESVILVNMAWVALDQDDDERATQLAEAALAHQRRFGFAWGEADSLFALARVAHRRGDPATAPALCRESLVLAWDGRDPQQILLPLEQLAVLGGAAGLAEGAACLLGASERLYEDHRLRRDTSGYAGLKEAVATVRQALVEAQYGSGLAVGRVLPLEQVIAEALALADSLAATVIPAPSSEYPAGLTPREVDVLRLIVAGRTNAEIAAALFISPRTVTTHVTNIFAKLGVANRAEAIGFAHRHGLG